MGDFWVFGYGSLIWRPGFEFAEESRALLHGRRRSLCIYSWVHRGTRERPGLVLGLDAGGSCAGIARLVRASQREAVIAYLRERELVTDVYLERWLPVALADGRRVEALTYVVNMASPQYAGRLAVGEIAGLVSGASGLSGPNDEYVINTLHSLERLGIRDRTLEAVCRRLNSGQG